MKKVLCTILILLSIQTLCAQKSVSLFRLDTMRDSTGKIVRLVAFVKDSATKTIYISAFKGAELTYTRARMLDSLAARAKRRFTPYWLIVPVPGASSNSLQTSTDTSIQRLVIK